MSVIRLFLAGLSLLALFACDAHDAGEPPRPMGNFQLGLNIVVPETAQTIAISRKASPEEWKTAMTNAMQDRFGGYTGGKLFDFGISIDGYMLAPPGIPVVASPQSALIFTVNVWDDAKQELLVKGGKRIIYVEGVSAKSLIGSGWTQSKAQQLKKLTFNAAKLVQDYMLAHPEWLDLPPLTTPSDTKTNDSGAAKPLIPPTALDIPKLPA